MATKFYPILNNVIGGPKPACASFSGTMDLLRGGGLNTETTNTVNGPVGCGGTEVIMGSGVCHITVPLAAVTISGTITLNLWMAESNMSANAGAEVGIMLLSNSGAFVSNILGCSGASCSTAAAGTTYEFGTELPVTTRAAQNWTATPASTAVSAGQRLGLFVKLNDGGGTMASGFNCTFGFAGPTAAADGDSWIQFTETIVASSYVPRSPGVDSGTMHF